MINLFAGIVLNHSILQGIRNILPDNGIHIVVPGRSVSRPIPGEGTPGTVSNKYNINSEKIKNMCKNYPNKMECKYVFE